MKSCEEYRPMLMGLMDNELSPEEAMEANDHLTRCAACREEYEQMARTCSKIGTISFQEPGDALVASLWKSPLSRFSRLAGLWLVIGGYLALIGYGLYEFLKSGTEALFAKVALSAIAVGAIILLITVLRERIITSRTDPYKEVVR